MSTDTELPVEEALIGVLLEAQKALAGGENLQAYILIGESIKTLQGLVAIRERFVLFEQGVSEHELRQ